MVCLSCGSPEADAHSRCSQCQSFLGIAAEGRGYLPQLVHLQESLESGGLSADQAEEQLICLDEVLGESVAEIDALGQQLLTLPLDDAQAGTISGFLAPARESLAELRAVAAELPLEGGWSKDHWQRLETAQSRLFQASQGLQFLLAQVQRLAQP